MHVAATRQRARGATLRTRRTIRNDPHAPAESPYHQVRARMHAGDAQRAPRAQPRVRVTDHAERTCSYQRYRAERTRLSTTCHAEGACYQRYQHYRHCRHRRTAHRTAPAPRRTPSRLQGPVKTSGARSALGRPRGLGACARARARLGGSRLGFQADWASQIPATAAAGHDKRAGRDARRGSRPRLRPRQDMRGAAGTAPALVCGDAGALSRPVMSAARAADTPRQPRALAWRGSAAFERPPSCRLPGTGSKGSWCRAWACTPTAHGHGLASRRRGVAALLLPAKRRAMSSRPALGSSRRAAPRRAARRTPTEGACLAPHAGLRYRRLPTDSRRGRPRRGTSTSGGGTTPAHPPSRRAGAQLMHARSQDLEP